MTDVSRIFADAAPLPLSSRPAAALPACAPDPRDDVALGSHEALPGWTPRDVKVVTSQRPAGMLAAIFDVARGNPDSGEGQPLTAVQISAMAPFMAEAYQIPLDKVRTGLEGVRLYLGGPAANTPGYAVTLGRDIYVQTPEDLEAIESWGHRGWLAHECGHVMQMERAPSSLEQTRRVRRDMLHYGIHFLVDHNGGPGAAPRGFATWLNENFNPWNHAKTHVSLGTAIHDAHVMEREAERHARAFIDDTAGA